MSEFYECGQHFPPCEDIHARLSMTEETAAVFDRVNQVLEAWIDGRLIARGSNQILVTNAIHDYRDYRSRHGIAEAKKKFPDLLYR